MRMMPQAKTGGLPFAVLTTLALAACAEAPLAPYGASATLYDFTVNVISGPLKGTVAKGSFSYDNRTIGPAGSIGSAGAMTGRMTALDFAFNGTRYQHVNVDNTALNFDSSRHLVGASFGSNCSGHICQASPDSNDWLVEDTTFMYAARGALGVGVVSYSPAGRSSP